MEYVGLQTQIWRNNRNSTILLIGFPFLLLGLTVAFFFILNSVQPVWENQQDMYDAIYRTLPIVAGITLIWFIIAYFSHNRMIMRATHAKPLERQEDKRVYNLLENLCISRGLKMPKLYIIQDNSLNAFASGINDRTFAITVSKGLIEKLNDDELEAVLAHELTHIMNRDVRLLVVSIVFVGIFMFISEAALRGGLRSSGRRKGNGGAAIIIIIVLALVGWLISVLMRFAISRKREYMADAGAAELTKKPEALASALEKIAKDPTIEAVKRRRCGTALHRASNGEERLPKVALRHTPAHRKADCRVAAVLVGG